jgi:hypothetical protein
MEIFMSEIVERLRSKIDSSPNEIEAACNRAELGCYLARIGKIHDALVIVTDLRNSGGIVASPSVAAQVFLLEGLIRFFGNSQQSPRERIARALALSQAIDDQNMISRASAWKSHLDFLDGDFRNMRDSIDLSLARATGDTIESVARCCITIGCGHTLTGRDDLARRFFGVARDIAVSIGDEASIGAIIFNRAVHRISRERYRLRDNAFEILKDDLIDLEYSSSENFDIFTKNSALSSVSAIWRARLLILRGRSTEALRILNQECCVATGNIKEATSLDIDRAWCYYVSSELELSRSHLSRISSEDIIGMDADERALYFSLMAQLDVAAHASRKSDAVWMQRKRDAELEYEDTIARLSNELAGIQIPSQSRVSG